MPTFLSIAKGMEVLIANVEKERKAQRKAQKVHERHEKRTHERARKQALARYKYANMTQYEKVCHDLGSARAIFSEGKTARPQRKKVTAHVQLWVEPKPIRK